MVVKDTGDEGEGKGDTGKKARIFVPERQRTAASG